MDFLELAKERYSCRSFTDKKVEKEKLEKILEAGRIAPTAVNYQPQRILKLAKLSECTRFGWGAPVIMIICYDKNISWKRKYDGKDEGIIDASIVTTQMMLEIQDLGLGTTWIGSFDPQKIREVYEIPENLEIVSILPVGYPSEDLEEKLDLLAEKYDYIEGTKNIEVKKNKVYEIIEETTTKMI